MPTDPTRRAEAEWMRESKALAVAATIMAGAVVRIELRKAGKTDDEGLATANQWWLGHLDSIAELLQPNRAALSRASAEGRREEREACAEIARQKAAHHRKWGRHDLAESFDQIAEAIEARAKEDK